MEARKESGGVEVWCEKCGACKRFWIGKAIFIDVRAR